MCAFMCACGLWICTGVRKKPRCLKIIDVFGAVRQHWKTHQEATNIYIQAQKKTNINTLATYSHQYCTQAKLQHNCNNTKCNKIATEMQHNVNNKNCNTIATKLQQNVNTIATLCCKIFLICVGMKVGRYSGSDEKGTRIPGSHTRQRPRGGRGRRSQQNCNTIATEIHKHVNNKKCNTIATKMQHNVNTIATLCCKIFLIRVEGIKFREIHTGACAN
jgi:hypothetical protein